MKLVLPEGDFKAYLFDCDGTIVDSMPLHYKAWKHILDQHDCPFPEEQFYAMGGMPIREIFDTLNRLHGLSMPIEEVARTKEQHYLRSLDQLEAVPEVLEHIHEAHGRVPFAVVSGSARESVVHSLNALGLLDRFETLVCAGDYTHSKPHPEPFLIAAQRLGVAPKDCVVFEDTEMGIASAKAAGMSCGPSPPTPRTLTFLAKRVDHAKPAKLLSMVQVFGIEHIRSPCDGCFDNQRIIEAQTISKGSVDCGDDDLLVNTDDLHSLQQLKRCL